jgi:hypothetical protein
MGNRRTSIDLIVAGLVRRHLRSATLHRIMALGTSSLAAMAVAVLAKLGGESLAASVLAGGSAFLGILRLLGIAESRRPRHGNEDPR